jgi:hypothetical protein
MRGLQMPKYTFEIEGENERQHVYMANDKAAWSELVTWVGELLRDVDGELSPRAEIKCRMASESGKCLATLHIDANWNASDDVQPGTGFSRHHQPSPGRH